MEGLVFMPSNSSGQIESFELYTRQFPPDLHYFGKIIK